MQINKKDFLSERRAKRFIQYFSEGKYEKMQQLLDKNVKSFITNSKGGVNGLRSSAEFMSNIRALNTKNVKRQFRITQMITVKKYQIMFMLEVKARRKNESLHNFAAFLLNFKHGLIKEIRMVEALPLKSDIFWRK